MPAIVDCPTCSRRVEWTPANKWRPFCSERCKLVDLGAWATERYVVPGDTPGQGASADDAKRALPDARDG